MDTPLTTALLTCEAARENLLPLLIDLQQVGFDGEPGDVSSISSELAAALLVLAEACEALQPVLDSLRRGEPERLGRELRHIHRDLQILGRHVHVVETDDVEVSVVRWQRSFQAWDDSFRELIRSITEQRRIAAAQC